MTFCRAGRGRNPKRVWKRCGCGVEWASYGYGATEGSRRSANLNLEILFTIGAARVSRRELRTPVVCVVLCMW